MASVVRDFDILVPVVGYCRSTPPFSFCYRRLRIDKCVRIGVGQGETNLHSNESGHRPSGRKEGQERHAQSPAAGKFLGAAKYGTSLVAEDF